ncbi:MAG: clostripain-related cysteine peptidase [Candidatus Thermoplasmatota archaeon]|nr:clostripain-related cysteine peptidase [Candidatus Thermoplasmatota archaeon]
MRSKIVTILILTGLLSAGAMMLTDPENAQDTADLPEWTFMVYLDSDNNLEEAGIDDVNEMEKVGSTEDVNILVQMDRIEGFDTSNGDWTGTRRFRVEKDNDDAKLNSPELEDIGESNMGDPEVLIDFVKWSIENYPAKKYGLVLWNHGGAFRGICYDDTVPGLPEGEYDMINMTELNYAAEMIYQVAGNRRIDLCGFDACLMAQVAVLYELKDFVKVALSSGYNEPGDGWPYDSILQPLVDDPGMDERELARIVVDEYIRSYEDGAEDPDDSPMVTQAAFDMTKFDDLIVLLDQFSEELASRGPGGSFEYLTQIYLARKNANSYDMANVFIYDLTGYPLYDVIDFTKELENYILSAFPKNNLILELCDNIRDAIIDPANPSESFMFYSKADKWHPDANGLSMYFPNKETDDLTLTQLPSNYLPVYDETDFAREHLWDEFLHAFYGIEPIDDSLPTISFTAPEFNTTFTFKDYDPLVMLTGFAYDREMIDRIEIRVDSGEWKTIPGVTGQGKVVWLYQLDASDLGPGSHTIDAKARDRPVDTEAGTPGHITGTIRTQIYIENVPEDASDGFEVPDWAIGTLLMITIIGALLFGMMIYRGRTK